MGIRVQSWPDSIRPAIVAIDTLPFDSPADEIYGSIRTQLELAGTPIGGNDLIIAAQAVTLDLTLVSDNEREFARVAGLRIENWLKD